jgi:hypothetical protein
MVVVRVVLSPAPCLHRRPLLSLVSPCLLAPVSSLVSRVSFSCLLSPVPCLVSCLSRVLFVLFVLFVLCLVCLVSRVCLVKSCLFSIDRLLSPISYHLSPVSCLKSLVSSLLLVSCLFVSCLLVSCLLSLVFLSLVFFWLLSFCLLVF